MPPSSAARPARRSRTVPAHRLARVAVDAILSKKAVDVLVIDLRSVTDVADYFVVATGTSDLQIRAIVEAVEEQVRDAVGEKPWKREGADRLQWVILDYVDVVVHVMDPERRAFYALERLWGDAPSEQVAEDAVRVALLEDAPQP